MCTTQGFGSTWILYELPGLIRKELKSSQAALAARFDSGWTVSSSLPCGARKSSRTLPRSVFSAL